MDNHPSISRLEPVKANDLIALRHDIEPHNLLRGRIGRVLKVLSTTVLEVEFVDEDAKAVAIIQLRLEQVAILRQEATLDEAKFWNLIEDSKAASGGDPERQSQWLVDTLSEVSVADIFAFANLFHEHMEHAYHRDLWAAAYIICNGCSDDGFIDFRYFLIAQGKKIYYEALRDPEVLIDLFEVKRDFGFTYGDYELGGIESAAWNAFEKKTGEPRPLFFGMYDSRELTGDVPGDVWNEETVYQKYPKLSAKFHSFTDSNE